MQVVWMLVISAGSHYTCCSHRHRSVPVSFSEQVPADQRILRQQITEMGEDEVFNLRKDASRPPTMDDLDETQSAVIFPPKAIKVVKFKAKLLTTATTSQTPWSTSVADLRHAAPEDG